jgi:hypothetical protein
MKQRCLNPNSRDYKYYGGRADPVKLHKPWCEFLNFYQWLQNNIGLRPSKKHTLDRIENNGHYAPGNVRWATWSEQRRNSRERRGYKNPLKADQMKRYWASKSTVERSAYGKKMVIAKLSQR